MRRSIFRTIRCARVGPCSRCGEGFSSFYARFEEVVKQAAETEREPQNSAI